jgi:predicted Zn-dependent protease
MIAVVIALFSLVTYMMGTKKEENPVTGEMQRVGFDIEQGIALGLQSAPQMAAQHGGDHPSVEAQRKVDEVGMRLLRADPTIYNAPFRFNFTLLRDDQTVNAFALPGGQIFITAALFKQFEKEDELAGVLGHEIGHVIDRHSAQQMAKSKLFSGIGAAISAAAGGGQSGQMGAMVGQLINTKYGRSDELESDEWGVKLMYQAGYDPNSLVTVMEILERSAGGAGPPEFLSSHPSPKNRVQMIEKHIETYQHLARGSAAPAEPAPRSNPGGAELVIPGR